MAELGAGQGAADPREIYMVEDVKELGAEFCLGAFFPHEPGDVGSLDGGKVSVGISRSNKGVATQGAVQSETGGGE